MKISIIAASHREKSESKRVSDIIQLRLKELYQNLDCFSLDLGESSLPLWSPDKKNGNEVCVSLDKKKSEIFVSKPGGDDAPKHFTFDDVYDWTCNQESIYKDCASAIIDNILEGYNGTIFAYGQTGTGKTHTMTGVDKDPELRGIMPRAFIHIFKSIEADSEQT